MPEIRAPATFRLRRSSATRSSWRRASAALAIAREEKSTVSEVLFAVLAQLEAGSDAQAREPSYASAAEMPNCRHAVCSEIAEVIRPRDAVVKSKACALL